MEIELKEAKEANGFIDNDRVKRPRLDHEVEVATQAEPEAEPSAEAQLEAEADLVKAGSPAAAAA